MPSPLLFFPRGQGSKMLKLLKLSRLVESSSLNDNLLPLFGRSPPPHPTAGNSTQVSADTKSGGPPAVELSAHLDRAEEEADGQRLSSPSGPSLSLHLNCRPADIMLAGDWRAAGHSLAWGLASSPACGFRLNPVLGGSEDTGIVATSRKQEQGLTQQAG